MEVDTRKSCLVVDDSQVVRKLARLLLENLGFRCAEVGDGQQAVAACAQSMPDFILLDWNMPVMNGIEFCRHLRATPEGHTPKVIFCTTHDDPEHIEEAMSVGADEYMTKPFDRDVLAGKLRKLGLLN
jgi:two-component system, chemotaxis family, chemotaxis protein CheY